MSGQLPQLRQGRDGETQLYKLVNQLRRNVPAPTMTVIPVGPVDLLTIGETLWIPANSGGWVTTAVYLIPEVIDGVQSGAPQISVGISPSFDTIVTTISLGTALVVGEINPLTLVLPVVSETQDIMFHVDVGGTGPTTLTATSYIAGFFR